MNTNKKKKKNFLKKQCKNKADRILKSMMKCARVKICLPIIIENENFVCKMRFDESVMRF